MESVQNTTKARAVLPGAARQLATLALTFSEDGNQAEAAGLFAHSLTILEVGEYTRMHMCMFHSLWLRPSTT